MHINFVTLPPLPPLYPAGMYPEMQREYEQALSIFDEGKRNEKLSVLDSQWAEKIILASDVAQSGEKGYILFDDEGRSYNTPLEEATRCMNGLQGI
jgi:hypothetical protein